MAERGPSARAHVDGPGRSAAIGLLLVLLIAALGGCQERTPPPTPSPTSTRTATALSPTAHHSSTATQRPITATRTLTPTETNTSPPPTATGTPTPTVPPPLRLATAEALRRSGDYEYAVAEYAAVINATPEPDLAEKALFGLGETYYLQGDNRMAADVLGHFLNNYPHSPLVPAALYRLATAHSQLGNWSDARDYYERYIQMQERVSAPVYARLGDIYARLGEQEMAVEAYRRALEASASSAEQRQITEELALLYRKLGRTDSAVEYYEKAIALTSQAAYQARLLYEIGLTLQEAERTEEAAKRYREVMDKYPQEYGAYQSLLALISLGAKDIDPLQRGIVDYYAGQYAVCLNILNEYVSDHGARNAPLAHLYIGLAHRQLGNWKAALQAFEAILAEYPESAYVPQALYQKAYALRMLGEDEQALSTYRRLAIWYPRHELLPDALWQQAQLLESLKQWNLASDIYRSLAIQYPQSWLAERARLASGMVHYLRGDYAAAAEAWQRVLKESASAVPAVSPALQAKLLCWSGKALQALARDEEARALWREAMAIAPDSFYGLQAAALSGLAPAAAIRGGAERWYNLAFYPAPQRDETVEEWLRSWGGSALEGADSFAAAQERVRREEAYRNGCALLAGGAGEEAAAEFARLREILRDRPLALYALALDLYEMGLYRPAIACAERIIALAGPRSLRDLPVALLRLAYPVPYAELIVGEARSYGLDPRLFFALVRQESRFDAAATSWAGARGLSQVMPATGEWIAGMMGVRRFRKEDLYRPRLNVQYGLWYLAWALDLFAGEPLVALAAYNGGPGNAKGWAKKLPLDDVEMFVENITSAETKTYVTSVWEQYHVYRWLYPIPGDS